MKFQTFTALSLLLYFAVPVSFAATNLASAQGEQSSQSSSQTVASGVSGGQTIPSFPLELLKVNAIEGTGIDAVVNTGRNAVAGFARESVQSAASAQPGTLAMLLTGLGVMGSIARRRRLARKSF